MPTTFHFMVSTKMNYAVVTPYIPGGSILARTIGLRRIITHSLNLFLALLSERLQPRHIMEQN